MGDSQKLIVVLLVLAILFSVASIVISMDSDVDLEIPKPTVAANVVVQSGGGGLGFVVEGVGG